MPVARRLLRAALGEAIMLRQTPSRVGRAANVERGADGNGAQQIAAIECRDRLFHHFDAA